MSYFDKYVSRVRAGDRPSILELVQALDEHDPLCVPLPPAVEVDAYAVALDEIQESVNTGLPTPWEQ